MTTIPTTTLNNGVEMPVLGYGVFQTPPEETARCVREALEVGYRLMDTAQAYGNEEGVDQAVRDSGVARHGVVHESWAPFAEGRNDVFTNPVLAAIGEAHGKTAGQVILRPLIQKDVVVIPKTVHRARMEDNLDVLDFELSDAEMGQFSALEDPSFPRIFDHTVPATVEWLLGALVKKQLDGGMLY